MVRVPAGKFATSHLMTSDELTNTDTQHSEGIPWSVELINMDINMVIHGGSLNLEVASLHTVVTFRIFPPSSLRTQRAFLRMLLQYLSNGSSSSINGSKNSRCASM